MDMNCNKERQRAQTPEHRMKRGIAAPIKAFSNPPCCDPKAGALLGCATPRLEYVEFHFLQQVFCLCECFGAMADRIFLLRRQLR